MTVLDNGVRVATENNSRGSATVGVYIDVGSRLENLENNGVSSFLEKLTRRVSKRRDWEIS